MSEIEKTLSLSIFHLATVADQSQIRSLNSKERKMISQIANCILSGKELPNIKQEMFNKIKEKLEIESFELEDRDPKKLLEEQTIKARVGRFFKHLFRPSTHSVIREVSKAKKLIAKKKEELSTIKDQIDTTTGDKTKLIKKQEKLQKISDYSIDKFQQRVEEGLQYLDGKLVIKPLDESAKKEDVDRLLEKLFRVDDFAQLNPKDKKTLVSVSNILKEVQHKLPFTSERELKFREEE